MMMCYIVCFCFNTLTLLPRKDPLKLDNYMIRYWSQKIIFKLVSPFWIMNEELSFPFISFFEFFHSWSSLSIFQKGGKFKIIFHLQYPIWSLPFKNKISFLNESPFHSTTDENSKRINTLWYTLRFWFMIHNVISMYLFWPSRKHQAELTIHSMNAKWAKMENNCKR